ncbi:MAG TPA: ROK family transcriptional regulator [Pseudonocardiaceae bacterium]|jgi:predicted NBD/HSP70 family sugar kinase|nr:ROK family transcriptional regulator [Pseudonocardiaceae bacterium]
MPQSQPAPTQPAGAHTVRRHNTGLVLGAIAEAGAASRAGVAARTGLTKATVSSLVEAMIAAGLVAETGQEQRSGRGRRGTELTLSPHGVHGLGIEIGVDYLATCLVDLTGEVRKRRIRGGDNRSRSVTSVLGRLAALTRTALADAQALGVGVGGLGLAVPGLVEPAAGLLRTAPNLGWREVDLDGELRARLDLGARPLLLGNEANFAALAELWAGHTTEEPDFICVSGEIGIGAGIVIGGGLFEGVRGFSGEIGHLALDPTGPRCSCGAHGCLEQLASVESILRAVGLWSAGAVDHDSVEALLERLRAGQPDTLAAIAAAGRWLGIGLAGMVNVLDVPTVVLGGRYASLQPWLAEPVAAELAHRVLGASWHPVRVLASTVGPYAAVRGAATAVVRAIRADPAQFVAALAAGVA